MGYIPLGLTLTPTQIGRIKKAMSDDCGLTLRLRPDQYSGQTLLPLSSRQVRDCSKDRTKGGRLALSRKQVRAIRAGNYLEPDTTGVRFYVEKRGRGMELTPTPFNDGKTLTTTSDTDLHSMANGLSNFNIYSIDELPEHIGANEQGVINAGERATGGTHWVGYWNGDDSSKVEYFDPFGVAPDPRTVRFLKTSGKPILWSTSQIQDLESKSCGHWVMTYLQSRRDGSMVDFIANFDTTDHSDNEEALEDVFFLKSSRSI